MRGDEEIGENNEEDEDTQKRKNGERGVEGRRAWGGWVGGKGIEHLIWRRSGRYLFSLWRRNVVLIP